MFFEQQEVPAPDERVNADDDRAVGGEAARDLAPPRALRHVHCERGGVQAGHDNARVEHTVVREVVRDVGERHERTEARDDGGHVDENL